MADLYNRDENPWRGWAAEGMYREEAFRTIARLAQEEMETRQYEEQARKEVEENKPGVIDRIMNGLFERDVARNVRAGQAPAEQQEPGGLLARFQEPGGTARSRKPTSTGIAAPSRGIQPRSREQQEWDPFARFRTEEGSAAAPRGRRPATQEAPGEIKQTPRASQQSEPTETEEQGPEQTMMFGAAEAVDQARQFAVSAWDWADDAFGEPGEDSALYKVLKEAPDLSDKLGWERPDGMISGFASDVLQFGTSVLLTLPAGGPLAGVARAGAVRAATALGAGARTTSVGGSLAHGATWGATADAVGFDPYGERLSTALNNVPYLKEAVPDWLAEHGEDVTEAGGRFRNVIEGGILGSAGELLFRGVGSLVRSARRPKPENHVPEAGNFREQAETLAAEEMTAAKAEIEKEIEIQEEVARVSAEPQEVQDLYVREAVENSVNDPEGSARKIAGVLDARDAAVREIDEEIAVQGTSARIDEHKRNIAATTRVLEKRATEYGSPVAKRVFTNYKEALVSNDPLLSPAPVGASPKQQRQHEFRVATDEFKEIRNALDQSPRVEYYRQAADSTERALSRMKSAGMENAEPEKWGELRADTVTGILNLRYRMFNDGILTAPQKRLRRRLRSAAAGMKQTRGLVVKLKKGLKAVHTGQAPARTEFEKQVADATPEQMGRIERRIESAWAVHERQMFEKISPDVDLRTATPEEIAEANRWFEEAGEDPLQRARDLAESKGLDPTRDVNRAVLEELEARLQGKVVAAADAQEQPHRWGADRKYRGNLKVLRGGRTRARKDYEPMTTAEFEDANAVVEDVLDADMGFERALKRAAYRRLSAENPNLAAVEPDPVMAADNQALKARMRKAIQEQLEANADSATETPAMRKKPKGSRVVPKYSVQKETTGKPQRKKPNTPPAQTGPKTRPVSKQNGKELSKVRRKPMDDDAAEMWRLLQAVDEMDADATAIIRAPRVRNIRVARTRGC